MSATRGRQTRLAEQQGQQRAPLPARSAHSPSLVLSVARDPGVRAPCARCRVVRPAVFAPGGAVSLELLVLWFYLIEVVVLFSQPSKLAANFYRCWRDGRLHKAQMHTPLGNLDEWLVGKPWPFFQSGVREPASDD